MTSENFDFSGHRADLLPVAKALGIAGSVIAILLALIVAPFQSNVFKSLPLLSDLMADNRLDGLAATFFNWPISTTLFSALAIVAPITSICGSMLSTSRFSAASILLIISTLILFGLYGLSVWGALAAALTGFSALLLIFSVPSLKAWYKRNEIAITPWLFLTPAILFFAVYVIIPIGQSFWISFHEWDGLGEKTWVGTANYERLLTNDRKFGISFWNNLKWLVLYLLAIPMGLFISLFLNQTVRGIRLYKSLFFFPFVISQVVVGLVFSWFYLPKEGLLNAILMTLGFEGVNILGDPTLATYGIIAAGLWPQTAYCMILYLTGLNAVDPEQVEAARLDGAKGWKMLWYVILPQLKPATFIAFVVTIIGALRSFDLISVMTNGGPFGSTRVLSFYMFEESLSEFGFRMGYGAAIAVVLFFIMLGFIVYFLWSMYQDEKQGSH